jgi:hypothetical protein
VVFVNAGVAAFTQTAAAPPAIGATTGIGFIVKSNVAVLVQVPLLKVYTNVTLPADKPVTNPPASTVADPVPLVTDHVPPEVASVKSAISFTQIDVVLPLIAATTGNAFTVTEEVVLLHPVDVSVKVKVAIPAETPVTSPALVTVAIALLLLNQVPPVDGDKLMVLPTHTEDAPVLTVGKAFTVMVAVPEIVFEQVGADWYTTLTKL